MGHSAESIEQPQTLLLSQTSKNLSHINDRENIPEKVGFYLELPAEIITHLSFHWLQSIDTYSQT